MKVLILTTHLNRGGIPRYVLNLAKGLKSRGHEAVVASSGGVWEKKFRDEAIRLLALPIGTKSIFSPRIFLSFRALCRFLGENPVDIVHSNTRVTQFLGWLLWKFKKVPYVSTFHGHYRGHLFRRLFRCDGLFSIAISEDVSRHMTQDLKIPAEKTRMIYNGIDEADYRTQLSAPEIKKKYGINGSPVIGILARLSPEKNHRTLIEAFELLQHDYRNAVLVIAGEGKLEPALRLMVKNFALEEKVLFLKGDEIAEVFPAFDISVLPSITEGLGMSALESLFLKIPVIVSDTGGLKEVIQHEKNGLVLKNSQDKVELYRDMKVLIDNPSLRNALVDRGYADARKKFSLDKWVDSMLEVYDEALEAGKVTYAA